MPHKQVIGCRSMKHNSPMHGAALRPAQCGSKTRTPKSSIAALASLAFAVAALVAFSGCASTNETVGKGKQALVCPQCKMVAVKVNRPYFGGFGRGSYGAYSGTTTVYQDTCPGCQGAITTLFKEGKLKHKCSICKDSPFTCPVFHPTNS